MGRLIIPLMLCEQKAMSQPLLYLSSYLEQHYQSYVDLMYDVSKTGTWENWIDFFLKGVESSARNAAIKARALQDLRRDYLAKVRVARSSALLAKIVDLLFAIPATTIPHAVRDLKVSYNSAKKQLHKLVELQIITPYLGPNDRPQWFFAPEIIRIVNAPDS
jgi:Fic family protein